MRIAQVIGTVTLNRAHPSLAGGSLRLAVPLALSDFMGETEPAGETLVVYDELSAGTGSFIAVSEGREAAQPFHPQVKPIDAYNAAILDQVHFDNDMLNSDGRTGRNSKV
jgi:ethanolamine utilization protein EutN